MAEAGVLLRERFLAQVAPASGAATRASVVKDAADATTVVTPADKEAERLLRRLLCQGGITHIVSEEALGDDGGPPRGVVPPTEGDPASPDEWVAVVDPLDGSHAFLRGLVGCFGVSCGLFRGGEPWSGVLAAPTLDELLVVERGIGAYWRVAGAPWRRVPPPAAGTGGEGSLRLEDSVLYLCRGNCPPQVWREPPLAILLPRALAVLCFRSCVVALLSLLTGRLDGAVLPQQRVWDLAGALPALTEAGFQVFLGQDHWRTPVPPDGLLALAPGAGIDFAAFSPRLDARELRALFGPCGVGRGVGAPPLEADAVAGRPGCPGQTGSG